MYFCIIRSTIARFDGRQNWEISKNAEIFPFFRPACCNNELIFLKPQTI